MRPIPSGLQAKLNGGATTLCRCWVITRRDGIVLGFTDHDEDVPLDAVICLAGTGLTASEATQQLGLAVTVTELSGALSSDALDEDDLAAGRFDAAQIAMWLVDWSEPSLRVLLSSGTLGEVRREGGAFVCEMRGLADRLAQESGRLYTAACDADLGDARCTVDRGDPALTGSGAVVSRASNTRLTVSGLDTFADGWFTAGRLSWTAGANAGLAIEIKTHTASGGTVTLDLWQTMAETIADGDAFTITAGCDKRFATCRDRFANAQNYRGFPHIPGNDFVVSYPVAGEPGNDGQRLVAE